jgi:hypothetical protein
MRGRLRAHALVGTTATVSCSPIVETRVHDIRAQVRVSASFSRVGTR